MRAALIRPHLRAWVSAIVGYDEQMAAEAIHYGEPSPTGTIILAFSEPVDAAWGVDAPGWRFSSLAAGLHTAPSVIRTHGVQRGIQLSLTPRGARAVLGLPIGELARAMVPLGDIAPRLEKCRARIEEMPSWRLRFEALQDGIEAEIASRRTPPRGDPLALHCWDLMRASGGASTVEELARTAGASRRTVGVHLARELGLSPKQAARVIRFERSTRMWRGRGAHGGQPATLADLAAACGYSDHAHLTREWRALGGQAPSTWEIFPNVQADPDPRRGG